MKNPVSIGLVGLGYWGEILAEAIHRTPSLSLVACVSSRSDRAQEIAEQYGCTAFTDVDEMLEEASSEAVALASANPDHPPQIKKALNRNRHVFVEKPLANTVTEAEELRSMHRDTNLVMAVGHEFRRAGPVRKLYACLEDNRIGRVLAAEANLSLQSSIRADGWQSTPDNCPGGTLLQLGIHPMDSLRYLLGEAEVTGASFRCVNADIPTVAQVTLEHRGGTLSSVTSSYLSPWTCFIHLYGTDGNLLYRTGPTPKVPMRELDSESELIHQTGSGVRRLSFPFKDPLVEQFEEFASAIRGEGTVEVGPTEGLEALRLVEQAGRLNQGEAG